MTMHVCSCSRIFISFCQLDGELERRKELGFTFQQIIRKELDILNEDEKSREAHQISFTATMVEAIRVLNDVTESTSQSTSDTLRPRYALVKI